MEILFLLGRALYGGFFVLMSYYHFTDSKKMAEHAESKGVFAPQTMVLLSGLLVFFGGLGVIIGVLVNLALIFIILFLIIISFVMHDYWKEVDEKARSISKTNFLKNMALLGAALMMFFIPTPWN